MKNKFRYLQFMKVKVAGPVDARLASLLAVITITPQS